MEKKILLIGEANEEQIKAWKDGNELGIFAVEQDGRIAYFKNPDFKIMDAYYSLGKKEIGVTEEWKGLAGMMFLGGSKDLTQSPKYLPDVIKHLQKAINKGESKLVNL